MVNKKNNKTKSERNMICQSENLIKSLRYFSTMESRIYFSMLKRLDYNAKEFSETRIDLKEFFEEWEAYSGCYYNQIRKSIEKFQDYTYCDSVNNERKKLFEYIRLDLHTHEILGKFSDDVKKDLLLPIGNTTPIRMEFSDLVKIKNRKCNIKVFEIILTKLFTEDETSWEVLARELAVILTNQTYVKNPSMLMTYIINPAVKDINDNIDGINLTCEISRNKRIIFTKVEE